MIIKILAAFLSAYYFVNVAGFPMVIKRILKRPGRLKPFDCVTCLSVWVAAGLYFAPQEISNFLFIIFSTGFIATRIK